METTMTKAGAARLAKAERIARALLHNADALDADRITHEVHGAINARLWRRAEQDARVLDATARLLCGDRADAIAICESRIYRGRVVRP